MNKREWLKRCETAYDMGLVTHENLCCLLNFTDIVMRLEGGQMGTFFMLMENEGTRTNQFHPRKTLANDDAGYAAHTLAALLNHPCQKCAEDKEAWHTRYGFCPHKEGGSMGHRKGSRLKK